MTDSIQKTIIQKLKEGLSPSVLEVENESHQHNVPAGSESHFKVTAVSSVFDGLRAVQRHQKVYALLKEELAGQVHALALHLYTLEEWSAVKTAPASPPCLGGSA